MHLSRIETAAASPSAAAKPDPRLARAACEFEAQMMKELLKPLTASGDEDAGTSNGELSGSTESLQGFAAEALGQALARQGGFGIASGIVRQLSSHGTTDVTMRTNQDTVLRQFK
ncbi:MAG TPA: hypothetical protein VF392_04330 [Terracidiphilus sp.]